MIKNSKESVCPECNGKGFIDVIQVGIEKRGFCENPDKIKNLQVKSDGELIARAVSIWNTRVQLLTPNQIPLLDQSKKKCCRTCEFSNGNEYGNDEPVDHLNCSFNDTGDIWVKPDDYCSYGYKERVAEK